MSRFQIKKTSAAIGILLLACICCGGLTRVYSDIEQRAFERAAQRVGVEPTSAGVAGYITGTIHVGMSRQQVERSLSTLTTIKVARRGYLEDVGSGWGPTSCDEIHLKWSWLPGQRDRIIACYDNVGALVLMKFAGLDAPALQISAPLRKQSP